MVRDGTSTGEERRGEERRGEQNKNRWEPTEEPDSKLNPPLPQGYKKNGTENLSTLHPCVIM